MAGTSAFLILIGLGAFFVLFYTWPLKYLALGEVAVLLVWGPLMIGGGYYVLAHHWDWNVVIASLPYVFGVTTVIFGKHIDKADDRQGRSGSSRFLCLIGERVARYRRPGHDDPAVPGYLLSDCHPLLHAGAGDCPARHSLPAPGPLPAFLKPKPSVPTTGFPGWAGWLAALFRAAGLRQQPCLRHVVPPGCDPGCGLRLWPAHLGVLAMSALTLHRRCNKRRALAAGASPAIGPRMDAAYNAVPIQLRGGSYARQFPDVAQGHLAADQAGRQAPVGRPRRRLQVADRHSIGRHPGDRVLLRDRRPAGLARRRLLLAAVDHRDLGLFVAHGTNNLLNDYTDFNRGVDKDNYFRTQYGVHPLVQGFWTNRQQLTWFVVSGVLATLAGVYALFYTHFNPITIGLFAFGALALLAYTYPFKYWGLGELAIFLIWGPIMIGAVYFVVTGNWNWNVVLAGVPYGLGVASINVGKHIDKRDDDLQKGVGTFPVRVGERAARLDRSGRA